MRRHVLECSTDAAVEENERPVEIGVLGEKEGMGEHVPLLRCDEQCQGCFHFAATVVFESFRLDPALDAAKNGEVPSSCEIFIEREGRAARRHGRQPIHCG